MDGYERKEENSTDERALNINSAKKNSGRVEETR